MKIDAVPTIFLPSEKVKKKKEGSVKKSIGVVENSHLELCKNEGMLHQFSD